MDDKIRGHTIQKKCGRKCMSTYACKGYYICSHLLPLGNHFNFANKTTAYHMISTNWKRKGEKKKKVRESYILGFYRGDRFPNNSPKLLNKNGRIQDHTQKYALITY